MARSLAPALAMAAVAAAQALAAPAADPCRPVAAERASSVMTEEAKDPRLAAIIRVRFAADFQTYFAYEAYARHDVRICDALKPLHSDDRRARHFEDDVCRTKYYEFVYVEALVRGSPDLGRACFDDSRWAGLSENGARRVCGLREAVFRRLGKAPDVESIRAGCAEMTAEADAKQKAKCAPYVRAFFGDDGGCDKAGAFVSSDEATHDVEQCRGFAAFRRKLDGRDPGGCAAHEICRALDGGAGELAARYAQKTLSEVCTALGGRPQ